MFRGRFDLFYVLARIKPGVPDEGGDDEMIMVGKKSVAPGSTGQPAPAGGDDDDELLMLGKQSTI